MYSLIKTPLFTTKEFFSLSKEEVKEYFKWFISIKNERLQILEKSVQEIYPEWKLDYTKNSLVDLYLWFKTKVAYRKMTDWEKMEIKKQISQTPLLTDVISLPELTLSDEAVSICFDVGVYLGDTLIHQNSEIKWVTKLNSAKYIYYGQPLIAKSMSKVPLNPRAAIEGIANRILDKDSEEFTFLKLFILTIERL